ncbi:MAG TPA: flagellar hook-associated protein FlgL [Steroidobacteraceae bacterium]|nr:flagellar hook-associated protein FlgL [Steroidobacteraceae bacterium]
MRISTSYLSQAFVDALDRQQSALALTQQQISTGLKFNQAAQDPSAASTSLGIQATLDQLTQYGTNSNLAQTRLSIEDSTLGTLTNTLQRVRDLAVQAVNATQTRETRASIATEIQQQLAGIVQLANAQDGSGQYLFSGTASGTTPFTESNGTFSYAGNQTQRFVQIGSNRQVADGDTGTRVFQQIRNGNGTFVVSASGANTGAAIVGTNSVTDPAAWAAGHPPYTLSFTSPTSYTITDSAVPPTTTAPATYTDGQTISFNGAQLQISGTPAAGDQFTVAPSANQDVFTTLQDLVAALNGSQSTSVGQANLNNTVNRAIEALDQSLNNVSNVRSDVGARLNALDTQNGSNSDVTLQLKSTLSTLRDADYASVVTQLNQQMTGLQAAQASYVRMQGLSLFNYIQ